MKTERPLSSQFLIGSIVLALALRGLFLISVGYRDAGNLYLYQCLMGKQPKTAPLAHAETYLQRSITLDKQNLLTYRSLGEVLTLKGHYPQAISTFLISRQSPSIHALQTVWLQFMGEQYLREQKYTQAAQIQNMMVRLTADRPMATELGCGTKVVQAAMGRAWRFGYEGDQRAKEMAYLLVSALSPNCPDVHYRLGELYYEQRRYTKAAQAYQQGIGVDSATLAKGYAGIGRTYLEMNRLDDTVTVAEIALQAGGWNWPYFLLGRVAQLQNKPALAQEYYHQVITSHSIEPGEEWAVWSAYFYMAWMAFDQQEYDTTISYLQSASQVMPGSTAEPQALKYLGDVYYRRQMLAEAIQVYKGAIALAPPTWDWAWRIHLALADAYRDQGQIDLAIQEYNWVLTWVPNDPYANGELAKLQKIRQEP